MARPINPYQGPAPAAMSQMGAGLLEVGANIGRTLAAGYESMGKGIAGGITSAASSIADYYKQNKEEQARFDATKKMFKAFESFLEPSQQEAIQGIFDDTKMSTAEKNQLTPLLMNYLGAAQTQRYAMQRGAQQEGGATTRTGMQIESQEKMPWIQNTAQSIYGGFGGTRSGTYQTPPKVPRSTGGSMMQPSSAPFDPYNLNF